MNRRSELSLARAAPDHTAGGELSPRTERTPRGARGVAGSRGMAGRSAVRPGGAGAHGQAVGSASFRAAPPLVAHRGGREALDSSHWSTPLPCSRCCGVRRGGGGGGASRRAVWRPSCTLVARLRTRPPRNATPRPGTPASERHATPRYAAAPPQPPPRPAPSSATPRGWAGMREERARRAQLASHVEMRKVSPNFLKEFVNE